MTTELENAFEEHHLHEIKKKSLRISKQIQQVLRVGLALTAETLSVTISSLAAKTQEEN